MSLKSLLFTFLSSATAISSSPSKSPPLSYDADLFRKDTKIYFLNAEFLYWAINEGGLEYAIQMQQPAWGPSTQAVGKYKQASFGWDPGFRFNVGYFNAPHYWDLYGQYTYFKGKGSNEINATNANNLYLNGTWAHPDPNGQIPLNQASSTVALHLNLLELLVSRRFHPNPHFRIQAFGGLSLAWLNQDWHIHYLDTSANRSLLKNEWGYFGPGVRIGTALDWFLGKAGIYLTSRHSLACFAGYYHNHNKQSSTYSQQGYDPNLPFRNTHYEDVRLATHFQTIVGPSWQWPFKNYRTEIFLGYELNLWFNLHENLRSLSGAPQGPKQTFIEDHVIGMQGLTFRVNLDF